MTCFLFIIIINLKGDFMNKKKIIKIISWLLVVLWLILIFFLSSMTSLESNNKSEKTINKVIKTTINTTNDIGITNKHPNNQKIQNIVANLNYPLRKCMHASIYLILALLLINALRKYNIKNRNIYLITLLFCIIYASVDEYHQTFVIGRTGQLLDVLIDSIGSSIGIIFYLIMTKIDKYIHKY